MILNAENVDSLLDFVFRIDDMIYRKATGTPAELAEKLGVSERSLYRFIRKMKCLNLPIINSRELTATLRLGDFGLSLKRWNSMCVLNMISEFS